MASNKHRIPENMTIEEAAEFWDTHSVADYESQLVEIEFSPGESITLVAIAGDFFPALEKHARLKGISIETLVNLWIQEKLSTETIR